MYHLKITSKISTRKLSRRIQQLTERKGLKLSLSLILASLLTFSACTEVEDAVKPERPEMVRKDAESIILDRGICSLPDYNAIRLQWYRSGDVDLSSYLIYRALDTSKTGEALEFTVLDTHYLYSFNPNIADTEYVDLQPLPGEMHYYFIKAKDDAGNLSPSSDTLRYQLDIKPYLESPSGMKNTDSIPTFIWKYSADFKFSIDYFIIRLENLTKNQLIWTHEISRRQYDGSEQELLYNINGTALETSLSPRYTYRWRLDAAGRRDAFGVSEEGAASRWIEFNIKE